MFNSLLKACEIFEIKTASLSQNQIEQALHQMSKEQNEEFDSEQAKMFAKELTEIGGKLEKPTQSDSEDMKILFKRSYKMLKNKDFIEFVNTMKLLEKLTRQFAPEEFDPELADFILDNDTWNWIYSLKNKGLNKLNKNDLFFLSILGDNLLYLGSKSSLII